jgi:hypothetical protein
MESREVRLLTRDGDIDEARGALLRRPVPPAVRGYLRPKRRPSRRQRAGASGD